MQRRWKWPWQRGGSVDNMRKIVNLECLEKLRAVLGLPGSPRHHIPPGVSLGAAFAQLNVQLPERGKLDDELSCALAADGVHVCCAAQVVLVRIKRDSETLQRWERRGFENALQDQSLRV